uniref:Cytochrome c oxidase subunit 2 n=1 Tax=Microceramus pontificus TaxID=513540 RepID=A0A343F264_9EUPU|nr:cytochrome c oxidase subunit II [Microceramus pontificus]ASP44434.1 cytochrome c oxidase subunit II [Microceramus pontificus]
MSFWGQLNLMDPVSQIQSEMILFHDHAMILLVGIFTVVSLVGVFIILSKFTSRNIHEAQTLEIVWTIIPALFLIWLAIPSLRLLYLLDEQANSSNTLKTIGHQWYWSYEMPYISDLSYDSYMVQESDLSKGEYRLLEVDNRTCVPLGVETSVITTSADVIHAWALPSLGLKMDSVPGRLNLMSMKPEVPGVYYGQCSEICGANHSFMPITVEVITLKDFVSL